MSVLSDAQIIALWLREGGPLSAAPQALARALSESGGSTSVTSANPDGGTNVGLYQLDTSGVGAGFTQEQLSDPYTNTAITVAATKGGANWSEWADAYSDYLGAAQAAVSQFQTDAGKGRALTAYITKELAQVTGAGAGGAGQASSGAAGAAGQAQSVADTASGVVAAAEIMLHDAAETLDWAWQWFEPGQGWRLAFGAGAIVLGYLGLRQWGIVPSVSSIAKAA